MRTRPVFVGAAACTAVLSTLLLRAGTVHSVGAQPLIYRVTASNNDLDSVEGLAVPGRWIELWYRQRNFIEGQPDAVDAFQWCAWKNNGNPVEIGISQADGVGVFRMTNLRQRTTVMLFPAAPKEDRCLGGLYTELLTRACDFPGANCTAWSAPTLHWLDVRKFAGPVGVAQGSVEHAEQAAISVADGPDDGPEPSDVTDVDQNGVDTTQPGFSFGQKVVWKCGGGGTASCPSVTIHDSSTAISADPEFPFVLGTLQAHRGGGSFFAATAVPRGEPLGFSVNVNVKFRGLLNVNLGCDQPKFFDFSPF